MKRILVYIYMCLTINVLLFGGSSFKRLGLEEGLSNETVECFYQDYIGYMWVGTSNGLNRFDGYTFTKYFYQKSDTNSLINNSIQTVYEDRYKNLWIGTSSGLQLFNRNNESFTYVPLPDGNFPIKAIFQDNKDNLWLGTLGGGLYKYSYKKKCLEVSEYTDIKNTSIDAIYEDKHGNIWIGTENIGVFVIDRNTNQLYNFKNGLNGSFKGFDFSNMKVRSICEDVKGNIWFGTYGNGVFVYDLNKQCINKNADIKLPSSALQVMSIISCSDNKIRIGVDGSGLYEYDPLTQKVEVLQNTEIDRQSIGSNAIHTLYEDRQHSLWIGAYTRGISYTGLQENKQFKVIKSIPGKVNVLPCFNVTAILPDNTGVLWIATDGGGLCLFNTKNNSYKKFNPPTIAGLNYNSALCLTKDRDNNIWAGYYRGGYICINPNNKGIQQFFDNSKKISQTGIENDVRVIMQDKKGNIWVGTNGQGVYCYSPVTKQIKRYIHQYANLNADITSNFIRSLFEDSKGFIWVGSTFGLTRYNPKNNEYISLFENRSDANSLLSNCVHHIAESTNGYLYFATSEGISMLDIPVWNAAYDKPNMKAENFRFKNYSSSEGLPDHNVYSIIEDNNQNMWIATGKGLSMLDTKRDIIRNYSIEESFNEVFNKSACYKASDGKLYFGSVKGLVSFYPDSVKEPSDNLTAVITDMKVNFESVFSSARSVKTNFDDNKIILSSSEKSINFEFSAIEMLFPNEIKYQYKLEGFDSKWNTTDASRRYATYTNLNPGTYKFLLKATNKNGIWNDTPTEYIITVLPPFWETKWFILLVLIIIVAVLYGVYVVRVKSIQMLNRKLEILVEARTKELIEEREKQKVQEIEKQELLLKQKELESNKLKAENELIQLRNQTLQDEVKRHNIEIEKKNSELVSMAIQTTNRIEIIVKLKKNLSDILVAANEESHSLISSLIAEIDKDNNVKKEWEQFEQHFNQTNNNFFVALKEKYTDLTPHDLRMCAYLRMNLSNKEIAVLQNISVRGVEKSRFRLRKKMMLENDENIVSFLMDINQFDR
jgi:ligand-binding sensor domain-containing protein/DNA-binding CsgD family transcriptional regulator